MKRVRDGQRSEQRVVNRARLRSSSGIYRDDTMQQDDDLGLIYSYEFLVSRWIDPESMSAVTDTHQDQI